MLNEIRENILEMKGVFLKASYKKSTTDHLKGVFQTRATGSLSYTSSKKSIFCRDTFIDEMRIEFLIYERESFVDELRSVFHRRTAKNLP